MNHVELIYDSDCPNVEGTRHNLRTALSSLGLPEHWQEWDRNSPASPEYARRYGSPTVLIDGRDVAGMEAQESNCCRIYQTSSGLQGVPAVEAIAGKLNASPPSSDRMSLVSIIGAAAAALAASLCCIVPLLMVGLGLGGAWAASFTALEPVRPVFVLVSLAMVSWALYRAFARDCGCSSESTRRRRIAYSTVAALILTMLAVPYIVPAIASQPNESHVADDSHSVVVLDVKGMTCPTCAVTIREALASREGIKDVRITTDPPEVWVSYDPTFTSPRTLADAVTAAGYAAGINAVVDRTSPAD